MNLLTQYASLPLPQKIKLFCIGKGVLVSRNAKAELTKNNTPISLYEYPTTAGVTFRLEDAGYINAPFVEEHETDSWDGVIFDYDAAAGKFLIRIEDFSSYVELVPLPGYIDQTNRLGEKVTDTTMSHVDRVRISPITGCVYNCQFCDLNQSRYTIHPIESLQASVDVAIEDKMLPPRHMLISGGTPGSRDYGRMDVIFEAMIGYRGLETDVMFTPRQDDLRIVDRLYEWGIYGYSMNVEIFDREQARKYAKEKYNIGLETFQQHIERAVELTGGNGRVRSILIAGLESVESTLRGVEWLAQMGCDPVLSPFRPAPGTKLADHPAPSLDDLYRLWCETEEIIERYKHKQIEVGPRCKPCQHNTMVLK